MMRPHVCLFTDSQRPSGVGEHMLLLAAELRNRYRVSLVCSPSPSCESLLTRAAALGIETFACFARYGGSTRLGEWLRANDVTIFHAHAGIAWEGHVGCLAARAAGVPSVLRTEHLPYLLTAREQQAAYRCLLSRVDRIICVSDTVAESFQAAGVPAQKLHVVRNGIATHDVTVEPACVRARLGLPLDSRLVLTIGRMAKQKGYRYLADAVPTVVEEHPDAYFVWIGDGPLTADLRRHVARLGMERRVLFAGRRDDARELLAAADLLVQPSLFEGLPLAVLEAMAAARPVVATRVSGITEAVEHDVTGLLVEAKNSGALARAILRALGEPSTARRWGQAGYLRFERSFSATRMAAETAALYESLSRPSEPLGVSAGANGNGVRPKEHAWYGRASASSGRVGSPAATSAISSALQTWR